MLHILISLTIVNTIPLLEDLHQHFTPQYAADWKVIGTELGLPSLELKAIEAGWPTNVKWCCNQVLEKWLEMDTAASWRKLFTVIESPAISSSALGKGMYSSCMCGIKTSDSESWPKKVELTHA